MTRQKTRVDVFISHAAAETPAAEKVARALRGIGLNPFQIRSVRASGRLATAVHEALEMCRAMIVVVGESSRTSNISYEIGAAWGMGKPIFVVAAKNSDISIPVSLQEHPVYPLSRLDELVEEIDREFGGSRVPRKRTAS